jgi:hypothetical protein
MIPDFLLVSISRASTTDAVGLTQYCLWSGVGNIWEGCDPPHAPPGPLDDPPATGGVITTGAPTAKSEK